MDYREEDYRRCNRWEYLLPFSIIYEMNSQMIHYWLIKPIRTFWSLWPFGWMPFGSFLVSSSLVSFTTSFQSPMSMDQQVGIPMFKPLSWAKKPYPVLHPVRVQISEIIVLTNSLLVASLRAQKSFPPLQTFVIDVISAVSSDLGTDDPNVLKHAKMSSTFIREWIYNRNSSMPETPTDAA